MESQRDVLVVTNNPEHRKELLHILDFLPVNIYVASTISQAEEVLNRDSALLAFSEERLPDGCYQSLLSSLRGRYPKNRMVLMLRAGEWDKYLDALRLGVSEVIYFPLQPTDIELAMIHATRDLGLDTTYRQDLEVVLENAYRNAYRMIPAGTQDQESSQIIQTADCNLKNKMQ